MQGDLAGMTCYTAKNNKVVWFVKSPPLEPPSLSQLQFRNIFRLYAQTWGTMKAIERQTWNDAARLGRLRINGYNLFSWWMRTRDDAVLETIERQTGVIIFRPNTSAPT